MEKELKSMVQSIFFALLVMYLAMVFIIISARSGISKEIAGLREQITVLTEKLSVKDSTFIDSGTVRFILNRDGTIKSK